MQLPSQILWYCVKYLPAELLMNLTQGPMGKIWNIADIQNVQVFGESRPDQRIFCKVSSKLKNF